MQQVRKVTLTNDQRLLLNFLISLLASATATGMQAAYQYSASSNVLNIGTLILTGLTVFGVSFGHGLYAYVPGHITEEIQALRDTVNDFQQPATPVSTPVVAPQPTSVVIHAANVTVPATPVSTPVVESMPEVVPVDDTTQKVAAVAANVAG